MAGNEPARHFRRLPPGSGKTAFKMDADEPYTATGNTDSAAALSIPVRANISKRRWTNVPYGYLGIRV